jgi:cell division inhibitor SepF
MAEGKMAGLRKFWDALGLSDGDAYPDYEPYEDQAPVTRAQQRPVTAYAPPSLESEAISNVRPLPILPADGGVGAIQTRPAPTSSGSVRPIPAPAAPKVQVVSPTSFHDAQEIGESFRSGQPVIINLGGVDRDLKRRLVDFAAGLIFGLEGEMQRVAESVFMLTPKNVEVSADERRKLQERGLLGG